MKMANIFKKLFDGMFPFGKSNGFVAITAALACLLFSGETAFSQNIPQETEAIGAVHFLNSLGAVSSVSRRGETMEGTVRCMKYTGLRWLRTGYEDNAPVGDFIQLHRQAKTKVSYGLLSGHSDLQRLITDARQLAKAGALLALEGSNEPNNWGITYMGEKGGGRDSWLPVAKLHRDLYAAVRNDPDLRTYPVWSTCETGAQTDNAGLQFLSVPEGASTLMPAGTTFADAANCHNYITHPSWHGLHNNQTWLSADPSKNCPVDGLYGNFGNTWLNHFEGYTEEELARLPKVTTETGYAVSPKDGVTEEVQARLYLNLYLSQFKRGWQYTAVYLLKGRANEPEHESYAFYTLDYKPKQAARYMHNFTSVLADDKDVRRPGKLSYVICDQPETTHDLLLQKSNGHFVLVLWGERFADGGTDRISLRFGKKHRQITVYDPTVSVSAVRTFERTDSLTLDVSDHPLILEIEK
ncbi:MAG: glycosyl hydrolase [Prevotellaceae bacterium]|jgi:hypothetical protein|nr:glycosyl hydrolase [Prevotellaceae bacterium]